MIPFRLTLFRAVPLLVVLAAGGCSLPQSGSLTAGDSEDPTPSVTLKDVYSGYFPIGAAVAAGEYGFDSFDTYGPALVGQFDTLVAENCMKAGVIHSAENIYSWGPADRLVNYASAHSMDVRGHALVWHTQPAAWMFADQGTPAETREYSRSRMETHISAVVGRYAEDLYCWDVVNEAITDSDSAVNIYRTDSPWYQAYGDPSYIQDAFDYAHAADPDCLLFYNDYSICNSGKRGRVVQMIEDLELIENHHLDGIGIQAHWNLVWPTLQQIEETVNTFHDMGLVVEITELDIDCYNGSGDFTVRPYSGFRDPLAERYREIFTLFRQLADEGKLSRVTLWGVADDHTWLDHMIGGQYYDSPTRKNYPLLFDALHGKKECYFAVRDF